MLIIDIAPSFLWLSIIWNSQFHTQIGTYDHFFWVSVKKKNCVQWFVYLIKSLRILIINNPFGNRMKYFHWTFFSLYQFQRKISTFVTARFTSDKLLCNSSLFHDLSPWFVLNELSNFPGNSFFSRITRLLLSTKGLKKTHNLIKMASHWIRLVLLSISTNQLVGQNSTFSFI